MCDISDDRNIEFLLHLWAGPLDNFMGLRVVKYLDGSISIDLPFVKNSAGQKCVEFPLSAMQSTCAPLSICILRRLIVPCFVEPLKRREISPVTCPSSGLYRAATVEYSCVQTRIRILPPQTAEPGLLHGIIYRQLPGGKGKAVN